MSSAGPPAAAGLVVAPFRGWLFDPDRVQLDDVVCPPYDVVEPDEDERMRARSPYNVVRLVRPKRPTATAGSRRSRYEKAAELLGTWRRDGTLRQDAEPALYVYEQRVNGTARRGVIGAVEIRDPADGVVVPHEDVFAGPVADRLALMAATGAQLEPILLTTDGLDGLDGWLADVTAIAPDAHALPGDGTEHRLWRVARPDAITAVQDAVHGTSALIADGHHRYATYRRLRADRRSSGLGAGPWDFGLALLVGTAPDALSLGAIHRTVRDARLPQASPGGERAGSSVLVTAQPHLDDADAARLVAEVAGWVTDRDGRARTVAMLATDGRRSVRLDCRPLGAGARDRLPAAVMAERVLPEVFGRDDGDRRVEYHHDPAAAVRAATTGAGVALLLPAPTLAEVRALAERGGRMPRKSTSFGPKPRSGLVLRTLD